MLFCCCSEIGAQRVKNKKALHLVKVLLRLLSRRGTERTQSKLRSLTFQRLADMIMSHAQVRLMVAETR